MAYPVVYSWQDDLDLEPNTHPTVAFALHAMRMTHIADLANKKAAAPPLVEVSGPWPFPAVPIPPDYKAPPTQPDAEPAPW